MPVVEKPTAVHCCCITVTVRNVSSHEVATKRGMPIAHMFPVDVVGTVPVKEKSKPPTSELSPSSFNFGDSRVPTE